MGTNEEEVVKKWGKVRRLEEHHQTGLLTLTLSKAKKARFSVVPIFLMLHYFYLILSHNKEAPDINAPRASLFGEAIANLDLSPIHVSQWNSDRC